MFRTRFSVADGILLFSVLFLALLLLLLPLLWKDKGSELEISTPNGSLRYSLKSDQIIPIELGEASMTVEIFEGRARVLKSTCPDGVCIRSGWIGKTGESLLCAPLGVRLQVIGQAGGDGNVDFVAG